MEISIQKHSKLILVCVGNTCVYPPSFFGNANNDQLKNNKFNDSEYLSLISSGIELKRVHKIDFNRYTVAQLQNILYARIKIYLDVTQNDKCIELIAKKSENGR